MKTLVVAPHADDELLGCGGTLLRRRDEGAIVGWLLVTTMQPGRDWKPQTVEARRREIELVRSGLGVLPEHLYELGFQTTELDQISAKVLIEKIAGVFAGFQPEEILLPHASDIHSDHRVVFDAAAACSKWFRSPFLKRVMAYETLSETDFALRPDGAFKPTTFVDITPYVERKIKLMQVYQTEMGNHPFPRSEAALRALAELRGAQSGFGGAEAFQLLRERL